ncbi:MAG: Rdx family protein [Pirellulales bacterium]|nr:Rdx family protein [Pirellulales bacterium]
MAEKVLTEYKQQINRFELEPSMGGCFEVTVNGQLIYSKLETDEFPDEGAIVEQVGQLL